MIFCHTTPVVNLIHLIFFYFFHKFHSAFLLLFHTKNALLFIFYVLELQHINTKLDSFLKLIQSDKEAVKNTIPYQYNNKPIIVS